MFPSVCIACCLGRFGRILRDVLSIRVSTMCWDGVAVRICAKQNAARTPNLCREYVLFSSLLFAILPHIGANCGQYRLGTVLYICNWLWYYAAEENILRRSNEHARTLQRALTSSIQHLFYYPVVVYLVRKCRPSLTVRLNLQNYKINVKLYIDRCILQS